MIFVIWHAAALAIYAIPQASPHPLAVAARRYVNPLIEPYLFLTSQWQQWNPAAPDPASSFRTFGIEINGPAGWQTLTTLTPDTLAWHHRFPEFRIVSDMAARPYPLQQQYLHLACQQFGLPGGVAIRMIHRDTFFTPDGPAGRPPIASLGYATVCPG